MTRTSNPRGLEFEKLLGFTFRWLGDTVERTPYIGDYGADLVIVRDDVRTLVQAKRWNRRVGVKAVQEIVAAKGTYKCSEAMVATNTTFTDQAIDLADANGVVL